MNSPIPLPPVKMNIYRRINAVRKEVTYVKKTAKGGLNYSIVSHDTVVSKLRPSLVTHGIIVIPTVTSYVQNGDRTETSITVKFINEDSPADVVSVDVIGFGLDKQDKGPGKAMTYATKTALLKIFTLESGDDEDPDTDQTTEHLTEGAASTVNSPNTPAVLLNSRVGAEHDGAWRVAGVLEKVFATENFATAEEVKFAILDNQKALVALKEMSVTAYESIVMMMMGLGASKAKSPEDINVFFETFKAGEIAHLKEKQKPLYDKLILEFKEAKGKLTKAKRM